MHLCFLLPNFLRLPGAALLLRVAWIDWRLVQLKDQTQASGTFFLWLDSEHSLALHFDLV
jgi:hypothetical protein